MILIFVVANEHRLHVRSEGCRPTQWDERSLS